MGFHPFPQRLKALLRLMLNVLEALAEQTKCALMLLIAPEKKLDSAFNVGGGVNADLGSHMSADSKRDRACADDDNVRA
jgi:hypothetical protein